MMTPIPVGSPLMTPRVAARLPHADAGEPTATTAGAIRLVVMLFVLMAGAALATWWLFLPSGAFDLREVEDARNVAFGGGVVALASGLAGRIWPRQSRYLAPVFAVSGGIFMGGLSIAAEARFAGIGVMTAVTSGVAFLSLFTLYRSGLVRLSDRVKALLLTAVSAVGLIYLFSFVALFLGYRLPVIHGAGIGAALWYGFISALAALNLLVDFERIESLNGRGLAPVAEWHAALGLLTTFVWMYVALLRMIRALGR